MGVLYGSSELREVQQGAWQCRGCGGTIGLVGSGAIGGGWLVERRRTGKTHARG